MSAAPKRNPSLGLDSLDAEARKAARHGRMIDPKHAGRCGQAAVTRERNKDANVGPIGACAKTISH